MRSARFGSNPSVTARPPQNGSTSRCSLNRFHSGSTCGTNHRLPPAHFNGGRTPRAFGSSMVCRVNDCIGAGFLSRRYTQPGTVLPSGEYSFDCNYICLAWQLVILPRPKILPTVKQTVEVQDNSFLKGTLDPFGFATRKSQRAGGLWLALPWLHGDLSRDRAIGFSSVRPSSRSFSRPFYRS